MRKVLTNPNFKIYLILFLISLGVCLFLPVSWSDDSVFQNKVSNTDLFSFIQGSARPFTDSFTYIFSKYNFLWRLINPLLMILLPYGISELFSFKLSVKETVVFFLCLVYPTMVIVDAGFIATTLNYLWPVTFGILSLLPLKKLIFNEDVKWYEFIITFPLILYSTNMQQMSVVLNAVLFGANIYLIIKRFFNLNVLLQFLVAAAGLVWSFYLNFFGDNNRMVRECGRYFPYFSELGIFQKTELGFSSTLYSMTMNPHFAVVGFLFFTLFISVMLCLKKSSVISIVVSLIPPLFTVVMSIMKFVPDSRIYSFVSGELRNFGLEKAYYSFNPVTDVIFLLLSICVLYTIYCLLNNKCKFFVSFIVLCLGLGTRIMMGFSPTVWASGNRTFCILFITFIIVGFMIYNDYKLEKQIKK